MPEKKELLEGMTIEELRLMAKAKGIPNYADKSKSELVGLVAEEYKKEEIEEWLGIEESKEEVEDDIEGSEEGKVDEEEPTSIVEKIESNLLVVGVIICVVAIVVGFSAGYFLIGSGDGSGNGNNNYVNENLNFSLSVPSGWYLQSPSYSENTFIFIDNEVENQTRALGAIYAGPKENSLDEIKNFVQMQFESNENTIITEEPQYVKDNRAVYFKLDMISGQSVVKSRYLIMVDQMTYQVITQVPENQYEKYEPKMDQIFDTFNTI